MVSFAQVRTSNAHLATRFPDPLVAVFVGGTSGVGEYTVKAFAKYIPQPRVYIIGRNEKAAERITSECRAVNPKGKYVFMQADVSLLVNVDEICREIKRKETVVNLLVLSQGSMAFSKTTSEGLPLASSLIMHSRLRFILNLLPLLQNAANVNSANPSSSSASLSAASESYLSRVVSVGAATFEGPIDTANIPGTGFPLRQWRDQSTSAHTLLLEEASRRARHMMAEMMTGFNANTNEGGDTTTTSKSNNNNNNNHNHSSSNNVVSFVHTLPGMVQSNIMRDMEPSFRLSLTVMLSKLLSPFVATSPEECAERQLFAATSRRFACRSPISSSFTSDERNGDISDAKAEEAEDEVQQESPARGTDGVIGSGVYSVNSQSETASVRVEELLRGLREDGTAGKVWDYVRGDYLRVTGTEMMV